jgi:hypothetical protein
MVKFAAHLISARQFRYNMPNAIENEESDESSEMGDKRTTPKE